MLTATALAFVVNIAGAVLNWTYVKIGRVGTQIALFIVALLGAFWYSYGSSFPQITTVLQEGAVIFSMAVAFYEVLLSRFAIFSGPAQQ